MPNYTFETITVNKIGACDEYIRANVDWVSIFDGLTSNPLVVHTLESLTELQLTNLTTLLGSYVDPNIYLVVDHTSTLTLHSHFTNDSINVIIDNKEVIQTLIFPVKTSDTYVLDTAKTVIEYNCPNPQAFLNTTSGNITLDIFDITRNCCVSSRTVNLNEIATSWNTLAQSGSTVGNTVYRSLMFSGLMNTTPNHDVIFQFRGATSNSDFSFRMNGLQYIYYNVL